MPKNTRQYMGYDPKRELRKKQDSEPRRAKQEPPSPDDHGEFSHLPTSIKLMIIPKRENHT